MPKTLDRALCEFFTSIKKSDDFKKEEEKIRPALEKEYTEASCYYDHGHYKQAIDTFTKLTKRNPYDQKNWFGLGASLQMDEKYEEALKAWATSAILDAEDPLPHLHAAECLISLEDYDEAIKALNLAKKRATSMELKRKIDALITMNQRQ